MPADNNTPRGNPPPLATPAPAAPDRSAKTLWMRQEQLVRLLRSFARGGLAWFLVGIVFAPVREALGGGVWEHVNAIVAALVGIGVAIHAYRTIGDLEPKPPGLPERSPVEARYRAKAKEYGSGLGLGVSVLMLLVLVVALKGIVPWPANPETASPAEEVTGVIFMGIGIALFLWVSGVARDEYRDALARRYPRPIIPPDLVKNTQQARRALEQAEGQAQQALEQARRALEQTVMQAQEALEQGANVADELQDELEVKQRALDATQRQLSDTQEDVTVATSMRDEWYTRLARPLEGLLQRTGRRSFWSGFAANVIVGFVFYVLGVLTPVLVDADSLRALLQHWLRLG